MRIVDITGERFGRLVALKRVGSDGHSALWLCRCDCGNTKVVTLPHLRSGQTRSCGCLFKDTTPARVAKSNIGARMRKHGDFGTHLYSVWAAMKRRCYNPHVMHFSDYGGRGITVCDAWKEYIPFREWALQNGYAEGLSLDRIDVNGNYSPENCRWVTMTVQQNNRRNNVRLEYEGKSYSIQDIARISGVSERTARGRYERGWTVKEMLYGK